MATEVKEVPARQAMQYTIERAKATLEWLVETDEKFKNRGAGVDGYIYQRRKRILADAFAMYVSVLVEKGGKGHSLLKSFEKHEFVDRFIALPVVQKCIINRNRRSAHESKEYGEFVSPDELLNANLMPWLGELEYFVCAEGRPKVLKE